MEIRKSTIEKTVAYLNALASINPDRSFSPREHTAKRKLLKINSNIPTAANKLGFISHVGKGKWQTSLPKYDPIHARRVIETMYLSNPTLIKPVKKIVEKNITKEIVKPEPKQVHRKKTISIFWGLFTYSK